MNFVYGRYLWEMGGGGGGRVHKLTSKGRSPSPISNFESPLKISLLALFELPLIKVEGIKWKPIFLTNKIENYYLSMKLYVQRALRSKG